MTTQSRERLALSALGFILAVTGLWWALALWPLPDETPAWLLRTRAVCFGAERNTLPTPAGWMLLIGEPVAALAALFVVWKDEALSGLRALARSGPGRAGLGGTVVAAATGLALATLRVASAGERETDATGRGAAAAPMPDTYPRLNREAPPLRLVDQAGDTLALERYRGRPVLVTFAFAHCATVCPLVVHDVLDAQRRLADLAPVVLVITLDPWRDTPLRLPAIAAGWRLRGDAHVLSGDTAAVGLALDGWKVPRIRDERTGDVTHPSLAYIVDRGGRLAFVAAGRADAIVQLARRL